MPLRARFDPRRAAASMVLAAGCAVGSGDEGTGGAASLGGSTSPTMASVASFEDGGSGSDDDGTQGTGPASADDGPDSMTGPGDDGDTDTAGGEVCNGIDDDGDGTIDDGIPDLQCGMGACAATVVGCDGGVPTQCFPGTPTTEVCNGIDDDCNGGVDDGLTQGCATGCGEGTQACNAGQWGECNAPPPQAEMCNVVDDDCNGAVDDGVGGCRIEVHRWYHPVQGEHFYSTDPNEGFCCGFQLEALNYFRLYAGQQPNTTGFYRCLGGNGFHHYTTDPNCEGLQVEGLMGFIGTIDLPGATELYRSYHGGGDHFFTTSADEHAGAVAAGYIDEGVVGYVW
jgi:hypothetical protein